MSDPIASLELRLDISARIAAVRQLSALPQAEFARAIGVSQSYLSEVEQGKKSPNVPLLVGIIRAFPDTGAEWLLVGTGPARREAASREALPARELDRGALQTSFVVLGRMLASAPEVPSLEDQVEFAAVIYESYINVLHDSLSQGETEPDARKMADFVCRRMTSTAPGAKLAVGPPLPLAARAEQSKREPNK